jgi:hypothetical protein
MPPAPEWHQGRGAIETFLRNRYRQRKPRPWRFVACGANLQPAYAYYTEHDGAFVRGGIFVIGVRQDGIESITRFHDDGLLDRFGVPERL